MSIIASSSTIKLDIIGSVNQPSNFNKRLSTSVLYNSYLSSGLVIYDKSEICILFVCNISLHFIYD